MTTTNLRSLLLVLCISLLSPGAQGQTDSRAVSPDTSQAQKKKTRAISNETSSALSAGYSFQPQSPVEPSDEADLIDQRDLDKPRNEIIRLPKYMVEGQRPAIFRERDFYSTRAGMQQMQLQKFFGEGLLNRRQLGKTGEMYAAQSFWDDERLKGMTEMGRHASIYRLAGDDARANKAEREAKASYIRVNDAQSAELSKQAGQRY
jgi:hypothetical protein